MTTTDSKLFSLLSVYLERWYATLSCPSLHCGITDGITGGALAFAWMHKVNGKACHQHAAIDIISDILLTQNEWIKGTSVNLGAGLSGFGWLLQHLQQLELLGEDDVEETLRIIDQHTLAKVATETAKENLDYIRDASGMALYLTSRSLPLPASFIRKLKADPFREKGGSFH